MCLCVCVCRQWELSRRYFSLIGTAPFVVLCGSPAGGAHPVFLRCCVASCPSVCWRRGLTSPRILRWLPKHRVAPTPVSFGPIEGLSVLFITFGSRRHRFALVSSVRPLSAALCKNCATMSETTRGCQRCHHRRRHPQRRAAALLALAPVVAAAHRGAAVRRAAADRRAASLPTSVPICHHSFAESSTGWTRQSMGT